MVLSSKLDLLYRLGQRSPQIRYKKIHNWYGNIVLIQQKILRSQYQKEHWGAAGDTGKSTQYWANRDSDNSVLLHILARFQFWLRR